MARIDPSILRQLIAAAMEDATGIAMRYPGEADPEDEDHWGRLISVDVKGEPRVIRASGLAAEPDRARIVVVASVCSSVGVSDPAGGGGAWTHGAAANRLALTLDGKTLTDSDSTHKLELFRTEIREDPPGEQRGIRSSVITVEGYAQRHSGAGLSAAAAQPA